MVRSPTAIFRDRTLSDLPSKITATIDFGLPGRQHGYLNIPHSSNESAWGAIRMPVTCIANGEGPTLLFTGANHGDEYEGPVSLVKLARELDPATIQGRVIILPFLNYPAFLAASRCSPIDGANMNRVFPGRRDGTITEMIADYVTRNLLPLADCVCDIHSGGKTLKFMPFIGIHYLDDPALMLRSRAAMAAFGAPVALESIEVDSAGMMDGVVEGLGKIFMYTELGGGGTVTTETVSIAERGIRNLLRHFEILDEPLEATPTVEMEMPDERSFLISDHAGLFEPVADLGDAVMEGDVVCRIYRIEAPQEAPAEYRAARDGTVIGRNHKGLVAHGDFLAGIAIDRASHPDEDITL
ncbi:N-alpha-acetyl diaminobutyric acid deacetylase DoeB [Alphaproteobacteria bacterium HT1-32]|nr:N-alpha-acetyl diaminobutyric acid deacetylase DoeB [Alphaproteobacteria bacterium HT1-32]